MAHHCSSQPLSPHMPHCPSSLNLWEPFSLSRKLHFRPERFLISLRPPKEIGGRALRERPSCLEAGCGLNVGLVRGGRYWTLKNQKGERESKKGSHSPKNATGLCAPFFPFYSYPGSPYNDRQTPCHMIAPAHIHSFSRTKQ
jgi:hypothetical protein